MKERPILFSAPMVRAILEGRKTQTRRVIKPQPESHLDPDSVKGAWESGFIDVKCPYGQPGDRLWVRETFAWLPDGLNADQNHGRYHYRADGDLAVKWQPSIHMPRIASRITLRIKDVRVERLQDISDADALAEGVDQTNTSIRGYAAERFKRLWSSINGADSWHSNPWVWVIEFKKVEAAS